MHKSMRCHSVTVYTCLLHQARTGALCSKRPSGVLLRRSGSRLPHRRCPGPEMRSIESDQQRRSAPRVDNSCCPQCRVGEEHVRVTRIVWSSTTKAPVMVEPFDTREQSSHGSGRAGRRRSRTRSRAWSWDGSRLHWHGRTRRDRRPLLHGCTTLSRGDWSCHRRWITHTTECVCPCFYHRPVDLHNLQLAWELSSKVPIHRIWSVANQLDIEASFKRTLDSTLEGRPAIIFTTISSGQHY